MPDVITRERARHSRSSAFNSEALSAYLALRWLPSCEWAWVGAIKPVEVVCPPADRRVSTSADILAALRDITARACASRRVGILLSSGMDSAILAALLPVGTPAYTIRFDAPGATDESPVAARYAEECRLPHHVITVGWDDYERLLDPLMLRKRAPLHAVEVGLAKAAWTAARDGIDTLIVGNGADSTFGGLDQLLARDWSFDGFIERYTFVRPEQALVDGSPLREVFEPYRKGNAIDIERFLKIVHGTGVTQAFENGLHAGGCALVAPFEALVLADELDLARVRGGESKYLLRDLFARLYPKLPTPGKIAFARPMDAWMRDWPGPRRREFLPACHVGLTGEQRWLVFCLERFLDRLETYYGD